MRFRIRSLMLLVAAVAVGLALPLPITIAGAYLGIVALVYVQGIGRANLWGFMTLNELLVVTAILLIFAALIAPAVESTHCGRRPPPRVPFPPGSARGSRIVAPN